MSLRRQPSAININGLKKLPPINSQGEYKKGQRLSRSQSRILRRGLDAEEFKKVIKSRKASRLRDAVDAARGESMGGKRHRKTAKRRRAKKSCGWF